MDFLGSDRVTSGDETSYVLGMRIDRDLDTSDVDVVPKCICAFHVGAFWS